MEIKLECGITIEPNEGIFGLDEELDLTEGYDSRVRVYDNGGEPIELSAEDKMQIGTLMIDRWQRWMGTGEGPIWLKTKPMIDALVAKACEAGRGSDISIGVTDALMLSNYIFMLKGTVEKLMRNPLYVVSSANICMSELIAAHGIADELINVSTPTAEIGETLSTQNATSRAAALHASGAWKEYRGDFNAMTDEEIEHEVRSAETNLDEAESWLEAVASWKAVGKPRDDKKKDSANDPL